MLVTEYISETLVRHYSDAGYYVRQVETGDMYEDAVDLITTPITYIESDVLIPTDDESSEGDDEESEYAEAGRILLGEEE